MITTNNKSMKLQIVVLQLVELFLWFHLAVFGAPGPSCFNCVDVTSPRDCRQRTHCLPTQMCYTHQYTSSGVTSFDLGCQSKQVCRMAGNRPFLVGRRNVPVHTMCYSCCNGSNCNNILCVPHPPTTTTSTSITTTTTESTTASTKTSTRSTTTATTVTTAATTTTNPSTTITFAPTTTATTTPKIPVSDELFQRKCQPSVLKPSVLSCLPDTGGKLVHLSGAVYTGVTLIFIRGSADDLLINLDLFPKLQRITGGISGCSSLIGSDRAIFVNGHLCWYCPGGYTGFESSCYMIVYSSVHWDSAQSHCHSLGAGVHLLSINSQGEQSFIETLLKDFPVGEIWLGGYIHPFYRRWMWDDGSAVTYKHWDSVFPINDKSRDKMTMVNPNIDKVFNGFYWKNTVNSRYWAFICEVKA